MGPGQQSPQYHLNCPTDTWRVMTLCQTQQEQLGVVKHRSCLVHSVCARVYVTLIQILSWVLYVHVHLCVQDSYRASGRQVVKGPLNTDRHMRQKDNKNTHFHLGFDKEDSVSEQVGTCVHPVHKYIRT